MGGVGRIAPVLVALVAVAGVLRGASAARSPFSDSASSVEPESGQPSSSSGSPSSSSAAPAIIKHVDNPDMQVAITFDACATNTHGYGFDRPVFEVLQREQIPATIFVSGMWVESHPEEMKELAAEPMIEFANHSYDHPHMARMTIPEIEAEVDRTEAALGQHGLRSVAFRPPFGEFSERVLQVVRDRQLPAVLWDVVSGDPSAGTTAEAMIRTVVNKTRSGSIVIFHINGRETKTAPALLPILRQLRARGFQPVQLSTLLAWRHAGDPLPPPDENAILPLELPAVKVRAIHRTLDRPGQPAEFIEQVRPGCGGRSRGRMPCR